MKPDVPKICEICGGAHDTANHPKESREEEKLEIELNEISKSAKPVNVEGGTKKNIKSLRFWNDYALLTLDDGGKQISVINEKGEILTKIKTVETKSWRQAMKEFFPGLGSYEYIHPNGTGGHISLNSAPFYVQEVLKELYKGLPKHSSQPAYAMLGADVMLNMDLANANVNFFDGGKYIIISNSKEKMFKCLVTENEQGIVQAPKDWKTISTAGGDYNIKDAKLEKHVAEVLKKTENVHELNEAYSAVFTDVGISICKKDDINGKPLFQELIPSVKDNIAVDPANTKVVYYCSSESPSGITRLEMDGDDKSWKKTVAKLPKAYADIHNLQLDPSGSMLLFYSEGDLVMLAKDTLQEVVRQTGMTNVNFDSQGRIKAIDKEGYLVTYEFDVDHLREQTEKIRARKIAQNIEVKDVFSIAEKKKGGANETGAEFLEPLKAKIEGEAETALLKIQNFEHAKSFRRALETLKGNLGKEGLSYEEINFVTGGVEGKIFEKEKQFSADEAQKILDSFEKIMAMGLSISTLAEAKKELDAMKALEPFLDEDGRKKYVNAFKDFSLKSIEFFQKKGSEVIGEVQGMVDGIGRQLENLESKKEFDDWQEFRYPQVKSRINDLLRDCPMEADSAYKALLGARDGLQNLVDKYNQKFKEEYAKIREKAAERIDTMAQNVLSDINDLVSRIKTKGFKDRDDAELFLTGSESRKMIEEEIGQLANHNPDMAKELQRSLKVGMANVLSEIERGEDASVAETGQQMVSFGKVLFPKWEAKVKEKTKRQVEISFDADKKSIGPGTKKDEILGDVSLVITKGDGSKEKVRIYEGKNDEDEWRMGLLSMRGKNISPAYVTAGEFNDIRKKYAQWENGKLKEKLEKFRGELASLYAERQKPEDRDEKEDGAWQKKYREKMEKYSEFLAENHIALFRRADKVRNMEEIDENGKGFVPGWQGHWVIDPDTQKNLEFMAENFKMQLDLKESVMNLVGHAGTGKDVLVKIFCNKTNRPYFSTDCTKWTTEYELSEDVVLEAKDGATQTVRVPSAVLNGITTPGSVVYFNEVNAMPEQAQIFLHALWDEKRSLTLKTSSGKVIKADPTTLFVSSMNPNYPGTFDPQFATKSRMVTLEIKYPDLYKQSGAEDKNSNPPYNPSEALRIARETESFEDLTLDPNLEKNEFVKVWDRYVNGIANGAPEISLVQKFDLSAIKALVQFSNKLRENFILQFEKSRESRNALPVSQPITARELRRCSYMLNRMKPEEKAVADPDAIAKNLLERYFLSNIYNSEDREKIRNAMAAWRSQNRVAA